MPFRELFAELSADAFAIAKAIGEQAVKRAQERETLATSFRPGPVGQIPEVANEQPMSEWLMLRYGWRRFAISRCAYDRKVEVGARLDCGHRIDYKPIDERELHLAPNPAFAFIAALDRSVESTARCYCVRRAQPDENGR